MELAKWSSISILFVDLTCSSGEVSKESISMSKSWKKDFDDRFLWDTVNEDHSEEEREEDSGDEGSQDHQQLQSYVFDESWKWEHKFIEEQLKKYTKH